MRSTTWTSRLTSTRRKVRGLKIVWQSIRVLVQPSRRAKVSTRAIRWRKELGNKTKVWLLDLNLSNWQETSKKYSQQMRNLACRLAGEEVKRNKWLICLQTSCRQTKMTGKWTILVVQQALKDSLAVSWTSTRWWMEKRSIKWTLTTLYLTSVMI